MASTGRGCRLAAVIMLAATWIVPVGGGETSVVQPGGRPATSGVIRNAQEAFSVSVVPAVSVPVRIGARFGFHLSSGTAGYASLYMIDPVYSVQVLAENLPLAAGSLEYPSSSQVFTLRADPPVGFNWVILLVTRQPFSGFSGNDTLTTPVSTALDGRRFVSYLNGATRALLPSSWAVDEVRIRIVG